MVIHDCKAVFIHIPKTGGVSLTHAIMSEILGYRTHGEIGKMPNDLKFRFEVRNAQKHAFGKAFVPHHLSKGQWDEYYKFAVVRNPWDRLISEFHWRQTRPAHRPSTNLDEFITYCEKRMNSKSSRDIYWAHAQLQSDFVTGRKGKLLVDKLYRFENMPDTYIDLARKLNLPLRNEKHNTSDHKHYREYYNTKQRDRVAKLYRKDIEGFGYEF